MSLAASLLAGLGSIQTGAGQPDSSSPVGGVTSFNGLTGDVVYSPAVSAATFAALAAVPSASLGSGQLALVASAGAPFLLVASTAAAKTNLRIAASGKAGFQWVRLLSRNPVFEVQATWVIDPTNSTGLASDDNSGVDATHPLLTFSEHAWRWAEAQITASVAVTVLGAQQAGDEPIFTAHVAKGVTVTWTGTPTDLYSSTVTTFTLMNVVAAAADDAQFSDAAVPGGSFTAAGMAAKGTRLIATTGQQAIAYLLKDLGGTTCRTTRPMDASLNNVSFANGDTYKAQTLPAISFFVWRDDSPWGARLNTFNINIPASSTSNLTGPQLQNCYVSSLPTGKGGRFMNCCWDVGSYNFNGNQVGAAEVQISGGGFKGSGAQSITFSQSTTRSESTTVCFQGCGPVVENGVWNTGNICAYDFTGALLIAAGTGAVVHMLGFLGGKGNTSKLMSAGSGGQIRCSAAVQDGAAFVLASTTDATPIKAGGATSTAGLPSGIGGSGVYQYDANLLGAGIAAYDSNGVPALATKSNLTSLGGIVFFESDEVNLAAVGGSYAWTPAGLNGRFLLVLGVSARTTAVAGAFSAAGSVNGGNNGGVNNVMSASTGSQAATFAFGLNGRVAYAIQTPQQMLDLATPLTISVNAAATGTGGFVFKQKFNVWGILI
jgi:hypothetical protein